MTLQGIMTVRNILITFLLIGVLTAFWRACGTIPAIVGGASKWISSSQVVVLTFVMNGAVSFLLGSSFATAATMGVISMIMAQGMGTSPALAGGAILGGIYFGDRCSSVSTSALLVSELTKTDIYRNIHHMFRSALVPVAGSILFYLCLGRGDMNWQSQGEIVDFSSYFYLGLPVLLPAAAILVLGFFHVAVKKTMGAREALIKSLSDFILGFLCNARNSSTRIASYLRRAMTKQCIKILMKSDSAN